MATIARNIGSRGRQRRLQGGLVVAGLGVVAAAALILTGLPRGARLAVFLPFVAAAVGLLQARDHT